MDERLTRRRLLSAVTASSVSVGLAGCLSQFETDEGPSPDATAEGSDDVGEGSTESPCEVGAQFLRTVAEGSSEAAAAYYPFEHVDEFERADAVAAVESWDARIDVEWELAADECTDTDLPANDPLLSHLDDRGVEVSDARELAYSISVDRDERTEAPSITVLALSIDGEWFVSLAQGIDSSDDDDGPVEVSLELEPVAIEADARGEAAEVVVSVVGESGQPVAGATVVATGETADLESAVTETAGETSDGLAGTYDDLAAHQAVFAFDGSQELSDEQATGTIEFAVLPPADTGFVDDDPNPQLLVVR